MGIPAERKPALRLGVRYSERKDNPPPGLVWRKAKAGETIGTIADEYEVRWIDLALYNWNTAVPLEVNWYLHHYVGCTQNNGKTYSFTGQEQLNGNPDQKGGWLLVPDIPSSVKKKPSQSVAAVRNGRATHDKQFHVEVVEWLADGSYARVTGKWLYVFSGSGVDFGYDPPPPPASTEAPSMGQSETAFTLQFPGVFPISAKPDKVEYEIMITAEKGPSEALMAVLSGLRAQGEPYYKPGSNWYFLSGDILNNALSESRDRRNTHAWRNTKAVAIDLKDNKRYYFLLSPVQLGPEALKFAMANPKGLTPLLKPNDSTAIWDATDPNVWPVDRYVGPTADNVKRSGMTLEVIDPYSWAENIAGHGYRDSLQRYVEWLGINQNSSGKSRAIDELQKETGWTLDKIYIAQLLKAVRDHHPDPKSIDKQLKDPEKWKADLEKCNQRLTLTNAEINANAHRTLIQLCEWLKGPAHAIVETAILKDANANSLQDTVDVARGALHWYVCTENMVALEPGVAFLHDLFNSPGSVPTDIVVTSLDVDKATVTITETNQEALKLALPGTFGLLALKDFLAPPPKIAFNGQRQDYLQKLGDYQAARRDKLIKRINQYQITPAPLVAAKLNPAQAPSGGLLVLGAALNACLDGTDKLTNYVLTRKSKHDGAANLEEWYASHKGSKVKSLSMSWTLKGLAIVLNGWNLYAAITTARYDYQANQSTVTPLSWTQNVAGATAAVQDVLAEIANLLKNQHLKNIFPQLMTTGGNTYHYEVTTFETAAGVTFAAINVAAMLTAGVTTCISMYQNSSAASNRGDYTAASWYSFGFAGGALMTTGAACLALCLYEAGGIFTATGFGVTIGVLLFTIGGIISAVASLFAWLKSSDEFEIFARKCFLGTQADEEPRFGSDPEKWSNALTEGNNTWPLETQKRAIHNLLGRFSVETSFDPARLVLGSPMPAVVYTVKPGLFKSWSTIEVVLHYKDEKAPRTAATFVWDPTMPDEKVIRPVKSTSKGVFDPANTEVSFFHKDYMVSSIQVLAGQVDYNRDLGELLTTVTVRFPDLPNVIRTRKLVMKRHRRAPTGRFPASSSPQPVLDVDKESETSALFE